MKKPRPSPAGPKKSLYAAFRARENPLVHPLKVGSIDTAHMQAVRLKLSMTIIPKSSCGFAIAAHQNATPVTERCTSVNSISWRTRQTSSQAGRHRYKSRLNGSCLCAISHLLRRAAFDQDSFRHS
jgi:hypothetical protein